MSHWVRTQTTMRTGRKDQAEMVYGFYTKVRRPIRMAKGCSDVFIAACELAGVKPTVRQRNKYDRGVGAAFKVRNQIKVTQEGVVVA